MSHLGSESISIQYNQYMSESYFCCTICEKIESELRQNLSSASCSPSFSACSVKISQLPHVERSSYACFNTKIFVSDRCLKKAIKSQLKRARVMYWMIDLNLLSRVGRLRSRSTWGNNFKKTLKNSFIFRKIEKKELHWIFGVGPWNTTCFKYTWNYSPWCEESINIKYDYI
jgi:hypothetical protein